MLNELRIVRWMPTFAQASKLFRPYIAMQAPLLREAPSPLAVSLLIATPVVLPFRGELARVIRSCLSSRQRFRDGQHTLARETADSYCLGSHRSRDLWISGSLLPKYFWLRIDKTPMAIDYFYLTQSY